MREYRNLTYICATLTFISFVLCLRCFGCEADRMFYDFSLACFGSSFLGLIMSLSSYFSQKKEAMIKFYLEANVVLNKFSNKLRYIDLPLDEEMFLWLLGLEERKDFHDSISPELEKYISFWKQDDTNKINCLFQSIRNEYSRDDVLCVDDVERIIDARLTESKNIIKEAYDKISECKDISLNNVNNAYNNMHFFFRRPKALCIADEMICGKFQSLKSDITIISSFGNHENGITEFMTERILLLNHTLFEVKQLTDEEKINDELYRSSYFNVFVYSRFLGEIRRNLVIFNRLTHGQFIPKFDRDKEDLCKASYKER